MKLFPGKVVIYLAATIAAAVAIVSSHPAAGQTIVGPEAAIVGQEIRLVVEGLKTPELDKAADWAKKLHVHVSSPVGSEPIADPELTIGLGTGGLRLRIYFSGDKPGVYVLVLLDNNTGGLALHRVIVNASAPSPIQPTTPADPTPGPVTPGPSKITKATFVYEKSKHPIPPQVANEFSSLNRKGILASFFEQDTVDGSGQTPDQYKIALQAARGSTLPCLVVQAGDAVVRVVVNPTTSQHVAEAVR